MKSSMFQGNYLFHVHTERTDGRLSTQDYFETAKHDGAKSVIFLEHIRRRPAYDVNAFVAEIRNRARETGVNAFVGFETKILPDGTLDISDLHLELGEVIGIAEHGFPDSLEQLKSSFLRMLELYPRKMTNKKFVWVHPGLWFKKRGIHPAESPDYLAMLTHAQDANVLIERNLRYSLVEESVLSRIAADALVLGADAHTIKDLEVWRNWHSSRQNTTASSVVSPPNLSDLVNSR